MKEEAHDADVPETKTPEVEKSETLVEKTSTPPIVDAPVEVEAEKAIDVAPATDKTDTLVEITSTPPIFDAPVKVEAEKVI